MGHLPPGLYEHPITRAIDAALEDLPATVTPLDPTTAPTLLARYLRARLRG